MPCWLLITSGHLWVCCYDLQVLTTGSWPTQTAQMCVLPQQLQQATEAFKKFYEDKHG